MANAASGMAVNDECKLKFGELQRKKAFRFLVFKIDEKLQQIMVEKSGGPDDFEFTTEDGVTTCQKSKIFFIAWSPQTSATDREVADTNNNKRWSF